MKNKTRHTGIMPHLTRLESSSNGNPRYTFYFDGWNVVTRVDDNISYGLSNYIGKQVEVVIGSHYGRATLDSIREVEPQENTQ